jgi:Rieske Fe-S protein
MGKDRAPGPFKNKEVMSYHGPGQSARPFNSWVAQGQIIPSKQGNIMEPVQPVQQPSQRKRDFLKYFLGGGVIAWAASVLYPLLAYLKPPVQPEVEVSSVRVGKLDEIAKDSGTIVRFGSKPVLLVRGPDGELHAVSATCTHLDCTVQYRADLGVIWCACHNGKFDVSGRNIAGPPPRALEEYRVLIQGDDVFVSRSV